MSCSVVILMCRVVALFVVPYRRGYFEVSCNGGIFGLSCSAFILRCLMAEGF